MIEKTIPTSAGNDCVVVSVTSPAHGEFPARVHAVQPVLADYGFNSKEGCVKLTATVQERKGEPVLVTTAEEIFSLIPTVEGEKAFDRLQAAIGKSLTVVGLIREAKRTESWKMEITQVIE